MPVPTRNKSPSDSDSYSLYSTATSTMSIGDSLPAQLIRKTAKRGFTFNIMSVGPPSLNKTNVLSALFGKNIETRKEGTSKAKLTLSEMDVPLTIESKTFDIDYKNVRLKLTVVDSRDYGHALNLIGNHLPCVDYIDSQFADYHRRESLHDRRQLQDTMVHCLFFFISPYGHGLSELDLEFLKAVHNKVNVILIIPRAQVLTASERASFKRRVRDDLDKYRIKVYQMPDPEPDDTDDLKRLIKDIQETMPFAVTSVVLEKDMSVADQHFEWGTIDSTHKDHSDFALLKMMIQMQMCDLAEDTTRVFYEEYRLRQINRMK